MAKHIIASSLLTCTLAMAMISCDDNTGSLGIYEKGDGISNSTKSFEVTTQSLKMDSVIASSVTNYLGCITDPETGTDITADFAAQFYSFENYKFPDKEVMVGEVAGNTSTGIVQCDSCEVRLYFERYYGDSNNPLKLEVYELSESKLLEEDSIFYTDVDLTKFLPDGAKPIASRVFSPRDYNVSESTLNSSSYTHNIRIVLPKSVGQNIMEKYYENPDRFKNSYEFIRNVLPGLYFHISNGKGTMIAVSVGTLNLYYRYCDPYNQKQIYSGITRFAATPEVIQSTHFENENIDALVADKSCTYLKTPAGICTEMTLPINQFYANEHATDSISMASITLTRYNKSQNNYHWGTPENLLMVRKHDSHNFFKEHKVADGRTSFIATYNSTYNTYTFDNICRLISYCKNEKTNEAKRAGITEEAWETLNPDWNKVLLIPVNTSTNSSGALVSVTHDLSLNSVRLVGGNTKLPMQIVYSKFYQE